MDYKVFSVHDMVSGTFGPPLVFRNDGEAKRDFLARLRSSAYPGSDFQLVLIGTYNPDTAALSYLDHQIIMVGEDRDDA